MKRIQRSPPPFDPSLDSGVGSTSDGTGRGFGGGDNKKGAPAVKQGTNRQVDWNVKLFNHAIDLNLSNR